MGTLSDFLNLMFLCFFSMIMSERLKYTSYATMLGKSEVGASTVPVGKQGVKLEWCV